MRELRKPESEHLYGESEWQELSNESKIYYVAEKEMHRRESLIIFSQEFFYDIWTFCCSFPKQKCRWKFYFFFLNHQTSCFAVKRYIRKGIPNEHRALIWMIVSGAQANMEQNPGYYHRLLEGEKNDKLVEAIKTGYCLDNTVYPCLSVLCPQMLRMKLCHGKLTFL